MTYLPNNILEITDTKFPQPWSKDIVHAIRIIHSTYERTMPTIPYYPMKRSLGQMLDWNTAIVTEGHTAVDPLYVEPVDPGSIVDGSPEGPISEAQGTNSVLDVGDSVRVWEIEPRLLKGMIRREAKQEEVQQWGFDKFRDLVIFIPLSWLDQRGVTAMPGDKVSWDGVAYEVLNTNRTSYWFNTNIRLFMALNCQTYRYGA